MVSVLLSRELQTHRVDGSGGDGGRDCYFSDDDGTDVYELKSFTGRVTPTRRRQVKRSLARAMEQAPRSWTLVVPIDASPPEQAWFDSLQAGVSARLDWKDKTWLEEKLAQYPDITRYFSGAAEEVVRLLGEIAREDALPDDARAPGERFSGAARRLNEVDPYYQFVYSVTGETTTVTAHPKYPDALRDRPLQVSATLRFDDSPASQEVRAALADFMTYGLRVVIPGVHVEGLVVDAPGGLGGNFPGAELVLDGTYEPAPEAAETIVLRIPPHPPIRVAVRLRVGERSRGQAGGFRLVSRDISGLLTLDLRVDAPQKTLRASLSYSYLPGVLPRDAVPVLRFCAALARGEQMAFADPGGAVFGTASGPFGPADWPQVYIQCAEKLAEIQDLAGATFALPVEFRPEDQRDMEYARALLRGEPVQATWSGMTAPLRADAAGNLLAQIDAHGELFTFAAAHQQTLAVAGGHLPLGVVQHWMPAVRMSNLNDVRAWYQAGASGTIEVGLVPGDDKRMTIRQLPGAILPSAPSG
ncbi:MAG: hypothetical protein M3Y33_01150 [Actinomycetota bacterium]|nr:hypothetical protein [Actinomycetota bacterium]